MNLDGTTIGAVLGFLGLVVTAISGVYIATRTNATEKESAAQRTLENTRDEAHEAVIALKDQRIQYLVEDLEKCKIEAKLRIEELEAENDALFAENVRLKGHTDE